MPKYEMTFSFLPISTILLGFHYQRGEYRTSESDEQRFFEEYSLGIIFIHLAITRFL